MSDTPRTDNEEYDLTIDYKTEEMTWVVDVGFARELEQELTEAKRLFVDNSDPFDLRMADREKWSKWHREFYPENY